MRNPDNLKLDGSLHGNVIDFNVLRASETAFSRSKLEMETLNFPNLLAAPKNERDKRQQ